MTDALKTDDMTALVERCRAMIRRITADEAHIDNIIAAFEDTADALERLAADSERLTRERDEARRSHNYMLSDRRAETEQLRSALAAARAENDMLREALRPFGDVGDYLAAETSGFQDEDDIRLCFGDSDHEVGPRLTHGDFLRARAALEQGGGDEW